MTSKYIQTHYNLSPWKLSSCPPGSLAVASKSGHNRSTMIGKAHELPAFQKGLGQVQMYSGVSRGVGEGVEEAADGVDRVTSSPLSELSEDGFESDTFSDDSLASSAISFAPTKTKRTSCKKPPPPPPPPKCYQHSHPNPEIPTFISESARQACVVCDVYWRCALNTKSQSLLIHNDKEEQVEEQSQSPLKPLPQKKAKLNEKKSISRAQHFREANVKHSGDP